MNFISNLFSKKNQIKVTREQKIYVGCYDGIGNELGILTADEFGYNSLGMAEALTATSINSLRENKLNVSDCVIKKISDNSIIFQSQMLGLFVSAYEYLVSTFNNQKFQSLNIDADSVIQEIKIGVNRGAMLWYGINKSDLRSKEYNSFLHSYNITRSELSEWHKSFLTNGEMPNTQPLSIIFNSELFASDFFEEATILDLYSLEIVLGLNIQDFIISAEKFVKVIIK